MTTSWRCHADMVDVTVNGVARQVGELLTVADLVGSYCQCSDGVAVARNGDVVPRSAWDHTPLRAGDRLEILTAAAGG